ncbi:MAG: hypothetical protein KDA45_11755 [Planctomycetales bacterium]|nr:hypothetical protein [Planctomycetales bacterium]
MAAIGLRFAGTAGPNAAAELTWIPAVGGPRVAGGWLTWRAGTRKHPGIVACHCLYGAAHYELANAVLVNK